ncbi:hypothetical protein LWI28_013759 [Acer negundo]|uniref:Uncharacterized protein n=1 Tax=Acer negundo TaxID=4023 RepID=A0AAD5IIG1_ACENE|nr:hypothetical protein LWI28_013759 [Acer negundo]
MSSATKADENVAVDAVAWMFNVVTPVGIIIVNKALMVMYGFSFATTLTGMHFGTTTILTAFLSLMWNPVGFYQIAKLSMIPVSCFLEVVLDKVRCGDNTKGFIAAFIAVWSTAMQQYCVHYLQRKYALGSLNLLGKRVDAYNYSFASVVCTW